MRTILLTIFVTIFTACGKIEENSPNRQSVTLSEGMGGNPEPGFARAIEPREFVFPEDHGPHPEYATEWWYFTGNLEDKFNRLFGYQLTIFRVSIDPEKPPTDSNWRTNQIFMGHFAISDIENKIHKSAEKINRAALDMAGTSENPIHIWLGPWSIKSQGAAFFPLKLVADYEDIRLDLFVDRGNKPLVLQGINGF